MASSNLVLTGGTPAGLSPVPVRVERKRGIVGAHP
jgi:hypothetical protein